MTRTTQTDSSAVTIRTPEELMADRVEEAMLTDRDTRYQLMQRILESNDRYRIMNENRMAEVADLKRELSDVTGLKEDFRRISDTAMHDIQDVRTELYWQTARAERYLLTLHDLVNTPRDPMVATTP